MNQVRPYLKSRDVSVFSELVRAVAHEPASAEKLGQMAKYYASEDAHSQIDAIVGAARAHHSSSYAAREAMLHAATDDNDPFASIVRVILGE